MRSLDNRKLSVCLAVAISGAAFWDRLVAELRTYGYNVVVWSEMSDAEYRCRRGLLGCLWVRFRVWCVFPVRVVLRCVFSLCARGSVLLAPTAPPYLPIIAALFLRPTGIKVCHLLYDLYPDQLVLAGKARRESFVSRALALSTRSALRQCAVTVFLGQRLRQVAEAQYGAARAGSIIEVGGDGLLFSGELAPATGGLRVLYSGNFGYAHDYHTLLDALTSPLPVGLELVFHSSGAGYEAFKRELACRGLPAGLVLAGPLRTSEWVNAMRLAHVALVTMKPGAEDILFPSKTYSAMLAGQAILAVCPRASDLAATIEASGAGWVVEPGEANELRALLVNLAENPELVQQTRIRSQAYAREHYDMAVIAKKWESLLNELVKRKGA